jgi:hypothetical protein
MRQIEKIRRAKIVFLKSQADFAFGKCGIGKRVTIWFPLANHVHFEP